MQIRTRLSLQFTVLTGSIIFICFVIAYFLSASHQEDEFYRRLENKAKTTAELLFKVKQIDSSVLVEIDKTLKDKLAKQKISVFDRPQHELFSTNRDYQFYLDSIFFSRIQSAKRMRFKKGMFENIAISHRILGRDYIIMASAIDEVGHNDNLHLRWILLILFIAALCLCFITGWFFAGRALYPLTEVVREVNGISEYNLKDRLHSRNEKDEIGQLIRTFNKLLDRIESAFGLQKLFITGASHEMKNPLTSITSQLQVLQLKERSGAEYREAIQSVLEDIRLLNQTTQDLLQYANLTYTENKDLHFHPIRIDEIIWECKDALQRTNAHYTLDFDIENLPLEDQSLIILGNESLLRVAFINLIENACKFSNAHSARVSLEFATNQIHVRIQDQGIGIQPHEIPLLFEPFYRSNNTSGKKGHGIGLALVQRIILLHQGSITVKSDFGKGSEFIVRFPLSDRKTEVS
ncbi:MAG: HAMP domain-containing histidine kinase [Chitinophagaceae bacterium]|nr:HAMP domain-containing histidine kinase [Chitinophagaceae bacterium]